MSVVDEDVVDFLGVKPEDETCLCLGISDHIDWEDVWFHLWLLEEKINYYVEFITAKQYQSQFPGFTFRSFEIDIYFKEVIPEICYRFLSLAERQFALLKITFKPIHFTGE